MSNRILSIDIRKQGVRAVRVRTSLKGNRIEAHASASFDDAPGDAAAFEDRLAWAVGVIVDELKGSGMGCLVSLAPEHFSFRNLQVPFKDRKKIRQVLAFELEPTLPFEIEALEVDFLQVRQAEQTDLIVAAVETRLLDSLEEILGRHDLGVRAITIGPAATALCIARSDREKPARFLLLDMDGPNATACVVLEGRIHMIRTLRAGKGSEPETSAKVLASGIDRMMAAFETLYDMDPQIEKVLLSGADYPDQPFLEALARHLDMEVALVNLANQSRLYLSAAVPESDPGAGFNSAMSLAGIETGSIRPFQFNRSHHIFQKYWAENRTELISVGVLAVFVFLLVMTQAIMENRRLGKQIGVIDQQMTEIFKQAFPEATRIQAPVQQMRASLAQLREQTGSGRTNRSSVSNIDILQDISVLIPEKVNVVLTRLVRDDTSVQVAGLTETFNAVDEMKMQLEKSDYFSQITISSANMDKAANRVRFRIRAELSEMQP